MLRIAVCDDEKNMVQSNTATLEAVLKELGITGEITTYTNSSNLLYDITEDGFHYDLLLSDIEMPELSGMELAERIKPFLPDIRIIFITSHIEYAIDAFELSIFRYVPKSDIEKRLPTAIKDAVSLINLEADKSYTIKAKGRFEKIPFRDILYIERDGKNAAINTANGLSKVRKSLQAVCDELNSEEFIFIDRGYIVNLIHIMQIKNSTAVLKNGTVLPISRSHLQAVKEQINNYWGNVI
ncbi:MAG: response regulator transcription factor [Ruminococcaceae bacterium]|nr:response regulator transcription factor [Oscillospiraceae bacterium]